MLLGDEVGSGGDGSEHRASVGRRTAAAGRAAAGHRESIRHGAAARRRRQPVSEIPAYHSARCRHPPASPRAPRDAIRVRRGVPVPALPRPRSRVRGRLGARARVRRRCRCCSSRCSAGSSSGRTALELLGSSSSPSVLTGHLRRQHRSIARSTGSSRRSTPGSVARFLNDGRRRRATAGSGAPSCRSARSRSPACLAVVLVIGRRPRRGRPLQRARARPRRTACSTTASDAAAATTPATSPDPADSGDGDESPEPDRRRARPPRRRSPSRRPIASADRHPRPHPARRGTARSA